MGIKKFRNIDGNDINPLWIPTNVGRYSPDNSLNTEKWINLDGVYARLTDTYPGTVLSVSCTVPTGFSVTGSPVTLTGTIAITNTFTAGSVVFAMGTGFAQDNSNFFWDDTNNRLGILTNAPASTFSVANLFKVDSSGNATFVNDTQYILLNEVRIHGYGTHNFFAGQTAGNFTLTATHTVAIGNNAGVGLTSATGNIFIGRQVGQAVTSSPDNVIIGRQAGDELIDGSGGNILIGSIVDPVPYATNTANSINIGNTLIGDRIARSVKFGNVESTAGGLTQAEACSILELESVTKGFLPPRMTEVQRDAISSAAEGLIIFNTTSNKLNVYASATWQEITSA